MISLNRLFLALAVAWLSSVCYDFLFKEDQKKQLVSLNKKVIFLLLSFSFKLKSAKKKKKKSTASNYSHFLPFGMTPPSSHLFQWFKDTGDEIRFAWSNSLHTRKTIRENFYKVYTAVPHSDLILTAAGTLSIAWLLRRSLHRYKNANDLPLSFFEGSRQKKLKGLAVSVNDSDNIRFYHRPHFYSLFKPNLSRQDLKYHTINIRLAGVDAPEMAHFGTKSQPFAQEAKEWLTRFVQGRTVCIQLHRIDQYGRAVATVWVRRSKFPWLWPVWWNVSLEMVRAGYATIYRDSGAEYNGILKDLEISEVKARKSKLGMWIQSKEEYQSPGDFKRANRLQAAILKSSKEESKEEFKEESKKESNLKIKIKKIDFISERHPQKFQRLVQI